jgi:protein-L-isoaspartate(D-aspartate) O-methyltransferase
MIHKRTIHREDRGIGMTSQGTRDRLVETLRKEGIRDERVLKAITQVPRHKFVDEALSSRAYENTALPIGQSQTISQPWIVARMTEALLDGGNPKKVLEVGTGSGYQAAILSQLVPTVFTVERIEELLKTARRRFHALRMNNIYLRYADGHLGWASQAPFDGIIVTAAAQSVPEQLLEQLAEGGRLVIPVTRNGQQRLLVIKRTEDGFSESDLGGVIFVPLLSGLSAVDKS